MRSCLVIDLTDGIVVLTSVFLILFLFDPLYRSRSKEKDSLEPLSDKKKAKEEKEDEKGEDVSTTHLVLANH